MDEYTTSALFHTCLTWASANVIGGRSPSGRLVLLGNRDTEEAVECEHDVGNAYEIAGGLQGIHSGGSSETWSHDGLSPFSPKEKGVGECVGKCVGAAPRRSCEGTPGEERMWGTFKEFTREDIKKIDVWITPKKSMRRASATGDTGSPGPNWGAMPPCNQAPEIKLPGTPGEEGMWGTFKEFTPKDIEKIDAWITPKKSTRRVSAMAGTGSAGPNRGAMPPCNKAEIKRPDFLVKDNACPLFHAELDVFLRKIEAAPIVLSEIDRVVPTFRRNSPNMGGGILELWALEVQREAATVDGGRKIPTQGEMQSIHGDSVLREVPGKGRAFQIFARVGKAPAVASLGLCYEILMG
ncbi:hypothetical protein JB92DRAFT_2832204 [Gautieria morchelliformis]|nr:hypothetical protein JB92DRAFT_2832204 [Gautieria morchelliformis]